jgi:hypothetical protein
VTTITFVVPIRTSNPLNGQHGHWSVKARKRTRERQAVARTVNSMIEAVGGIPIATTLRTMAHDGPVVVLFVRTKPQGGPLDDDGLRAALKSCRDGVALALGVDDGDTARVRFDYAEQRGEWGVRVEVRPMSAEEVRRCEATRLLAKTRASPLLTRARAQSGFAATPSLFRPGAK